MDICSASTYMKLGYRIKRTGWQHLPWLSSDNINHWQLTLNDLLANDWIILTEKHKEMKYAIGTDAKYIEDYFLHMDLKSFKKIAKVFNIK